jgi:hypothetical protein
MRKNYALVVNMLLLSAVGVGGCKEVFERSLDNVTVTLIAPGNHVISDSAVQAFYWQPVDSAIQYELVIVTPRFDSVVSLMTDTTISTNQIILRLDSAQYQWRVRAFNTVSTTQFCTPWTITIN